MIYGLNKFFFFSLFWLSLSKLSQAQVVPDDTLPQNSIVNSDCASSCQIEEGTTRGNNLLFHSFEQFSVPANGKAIFNHHSLIENIFTRVTGSSVSEIEGTIGTQILGKIGNQGSANLFLINPNGIIFGDNAQLNIGGSFLATTADSIFFADNYQFSASNPHTLPLLKVNVPIGLQFGEKPGEIVNQSDIKVDNGKTIALLGSGVTLDNGFLTAFDGKVELGSVSANSFVDLTQKTDSLTLSYDSVNQSERVAINNSQIITDSSINFDFSKIPPSGNIQIYGNEVKLFNDSTFSSFNLSSLDGGNIIIKAETLTVQDSRISTSTIGNGSAGNIIINADSVDILNIIQDDKLTGLLSRTLYDNGKAGNLNINTNKLTIQDGAQISVTTFGEGQGGNLTVNASESIDVIGRSLDGIPSGLFAQSQGENATGDAGDLQINTGKLRVRDGGKISVGATGSNNNISQGNGGKLIIDASKSIKVSSPDSSISSQTDGSGIAGNITISTPELNLLDGSISSQTGGSGNAGNITISTAELNLLDVGQISSNNFVTERFEISPENPLELVRIILDEPRFGFGNAGKIDITASNITLQNQGGITALSTASEGGNIDLKVDNLFSLRNNSEISASAGLESTPGSGGNINIEAEFILVFPSKNNHQITANAFEGKGGNIQIDTNSIFGRESITISASSNFGLDGTISINTPDVDPTSSLDKLPDVPINAEALFARNLCEIGTGTGKTAKRSSFINTGRGGIAPNPYEPLDSMNSDEDIFVDVQLPTKWMEDSVTKSTASGLGFAHRQRRLALPLPEGRSRKEPIVESTGWIVNQKGNVELVAEIPSASSKCSH